MISESEVSELNQFCTATYSCLLHGAHNPSFASTVFDLCSYFLSDKKFRYNETTKQQWASLLISSLTSCDNCTAATIQLLGLVSHSSNNAEPPEYFSGVLKIFLAWDNWIESANYFAMVRFICVALDKYPRFYSSNEFVGQIGIISSRLLSNRQHDILAYQLINCALFSLYPFAEASHMFNLMGILLRKYQRNKTTRDSLEVGRILCNMYLSSKANSCENSFVDFFDKMQEGLLESLFKASVIPTLSRLPASDDRRLFTFVSIEFADYFYKKSMETWIGMLKALISSQSNTHRALSSYQLNLTRLKYAQPIKYHSYLGLIGDEFDLVKAKLRYYQRSAVIPNQHIFAVDPVLAAQIQSFLA